MHSFRPAFRASLSACLLTAAGIALFSPPEAAAVPLSVVQARQLLKTAGDYLDPRYLPSASQRNGTVVLRTPIVGSTLAYFCSGTVVSRTHILTAAHCVESHDPRSPEFGTTNQTQIYFGGYSGPAIEARRHDIHPLYFDTELGSPAQGAFATGDLAVVTLSEPIPEGTRIYGLYNSDPFGRVATHISYGTTGNGSDPDEIFGLDNLQNGRIGQNLYETDLASLMGVGLAGAHLLYDFDDGTQTHNAMPWWASPDDTILPDGSILIEPLTDVFQDLGLGLDEVLIGGGDSGGGAFIDGLLAGVHSFGFTIDDVFCDGIVNPNPDNPYDTSGPWNPEIVNPADIDCALNSTFGEVGGDTSVAFFYDWIMTRLNTHSIPTPATFALFGFGVLALGLGRRRRAHVA